MRFLIIIFIISFFVLSCDDNQIEKPKGDPAIDSFNLAEGITTKTIYYPNGKVHFIREVDSLGHRRGFEKEYYENGILKHDIHFIGEIPWSVGKGNSIDGKPLNLGTLIFGTGLYNEYYDNGQLRKSGNFKKDECDSIWTFYHKNGKKAAEVNWKDGIQIGQSIQYFESGNKFREVPYVNGRRHGLATEYYDTIGAIRQTRNYVMDIENGEVLHYKLNGKLESKAKMRNGRFVDTCFRYDDKGKIIDQKVMKGL